MKIVRWVATVPLAVSISVAAWFLLIATLTGAHGGDDIITWVFRYSHIVIRAGVPTVLFVVSAVLITPSHGRKPGFIFFALSLLISGGGIESLQYYEFGPLAFWVTSFAGVVLGAIVGLLLSLKLQSWRTARQNQSLETTRGTQP